MTKKRNIALAILVSLCLVIAISSHFIKKNPRVKMLLSVINFTEKTLNDPAYIANGIDVMDLCRNYANSDTHFTGRVSLYNMEKLKSSTYFNVDLVRSFEQKRLACHADLDILWENVGKLDIYAENETVYMVVPILGDFGYAFPTGIDLFMKMPDLTHDINQEWFRQNMGNIFNLLRQIKLEDTGNTITNIDNDIGNEYIVTIPKGCGDFLWELLGMEPPTYDVVVTLYLTNDNRLCKMLLDLSDVLPGAVLTIDGTSLGTVIFEYELPKDENVKLTLFRNPEHVNYIDINCVYYENNGKQLTANGYLTWDNLEDGFSINVKKMEVKKEDELLVKTGFHGEIVSLKESPDVFNGKESYLYSLKKLDWYKIRDDAEGFINKLLDKMKNNIFKKE